MLSPLKYSIEASVNSLENGIETFILDLILDVPGYRYRMFAHKLIDKFFQNFQRAVDKINHVHVLLANCKIVEELLQI